MKTTRSGFTMIELIFVIVIIGILSSVAIPKLAASRDDAEKAVCVDGYNRWIKEFRSSYMASDDINDWKTKRLEDITNLPTSIPLGDNTIGIAQSARTIVHGRWVTYRCAGETVAWIKPFIENNTYKLYLYLKNSVSTPVGKKFNDIMKKKWSGRYYKKLEI